jgi:molybdate transport system substrate-binding protein
MHSIRRKFVLAAASLVCLTLTAFSTTVSAADLVVSAASSLTDAFKSVAQSYEAKNPGTKIVLNFGASDVLMQQIINGAPADVFASADQTAMDKAVAAKVIDTSTRKDFAANQIVMIVPTDSKLNLTSLKDLSKPEVVRVAYGNPASVPVGRYTQSALEAAGLWNTVSAKGVLAQNVRQALDYVSRGEVEAGFVFATDAAIMADKVKVAVRVPVTTPVTYPIAITSGSKQTPQAASFLAYVASPAGQDILAKYGFLRP